jgi:hypothetical protein
MKQREIKTFIEELGGKVLAVRRRKHFIVEAQFGPHTMSIVMPMSGSDWRGQANLRSFIKRQLSAMNDNKKPPHLMRVQG